MTSIASRKSSCSSNSHQDAASLSPGTRTLEVAYSMSVTMLWLLRLSRLQPVGAEVGASRGRRDEGVLAVGNGRVVALVDLKVGGDD